MRYCDHCHNEPKKVAKYKVTSEQKMDSYFCSQHIRSSFVRQWYKTGSVEYIGESVRRYNLPLDHKYSLVGIDYLTSEGATTCDNCNAVITNVATLKDEIGHIHNVGVDCATTLSFTDCNDFWKALEAEAKHKKYLSQARKIKKQQNARFEVKENRIFIYCGSQIMWNVSKEFYNNYINK